MQFSQKQSRGGGESLLLEQGKIWSLDGAQFF